jgi:1-phosphofructokinase family hexose kinase
MHAVWHIARKAGIMIYTLSVNPALDITLITDAIKKDRINSTEARSVSAGGKGFNSSRTLNCLDIPNTAISFCGGPFGSNIKDILDREDIISRLISIAGSIRVNIKMVEETSGRVVEFNEKGPVISGDELEKLFHLLYRNCEDADYFIVSGSLPRDMDTGIYKDIIDTLKKKDIKVLLDASGEALCRAEEALPYIIKINREEMEGLCRKYGTGQEKLAPELVKRGINMIMVTDGPRDTFYYDNTGTYRIKSPQDINGPYKTGAGDAVNAGLIYALQNGFGLEDRLKFAAACGNANILNDTPGRVEQKTVEDIAARIEVIKE